MGMKRSKRGITMQAKFDKFHADNPLVFQKLLEICLDLYEQGFRRCAIGLVYERARWLHYLQTTDHDYKLSNNYKPFYSRLLMAADSRLQWFFVIRTIRRFRRAS